MTSIAALPPASYGPSIERTQTDARRLQASGVHADQAYDPALDPAVNPALRADSVEQITVKGKRDNNNELSFWDVLDLVNPLQHIPIINTIYRHITGDTIKTPVQLIGATVLGGPIGFATAMVDSIIEESTGTDVGGHAMALLNKEPRTPTYAPIVMPGETQLADAREFIPDAVTPAAYAAAAYAAPTATAPANTAPAAATVAATNTSHQILRSAATQTAPPQAAPTEAEALVQTAQIAAQANVFPTFKRTAPSTNAAQAQAASANSNASLRAQGRFMPINRTSAMAVAPTRRDSDATATAELRARSRFAPGPMNVGGATLAPATLAAATASQNKVLNDTARTPSAQNVTAQEAYMQGRDLASGNAPAEMPAWFDGAMMDAIDKYKAMQTAR